MTTIKITRTKKLFALIDKLQKQAEIAILELDSKQEWLSFKREKFMESPQGQAWEKYLNDMRQLLNVIKELKKPEVDEEKLVKILSEPDDLSGMLNEISRLSKLLIEIDVRGRVLMDELKATGEERTG